MTNHGYEQDDAPDIEVALEVSGVQRTPCVLVLDTSSSMSSHDRIGKLNVGLKAFERAVKSDETLCQQVVLMVIGFGENVDLLSDWTQADEFVAPTLKAEGMTPMGEAMRVAHAAIQELRDKLKQHGIPYTRPWIFLMSDGGPNDDGWEQSAAESRRACEEKRTVVWPLAVPPGANAAALKAFARSDMQVFSVGEDANFEAVFEWLKTSLGALANSSPGQRLQLKAPTEIIIEA
jgi:uncharacterized protein YegL